VAKGCARFLHLPPSSLVRDFILVLVINQRKIPSFSRRNYKARIKMIQLPTELWLMIFDIVIAEGIIRVDQCDYTKFPYIQSILSASHLRYQIYDSYYRLRLVCRGFKVVLGAPPLQKWSDSSIFPLSTAIRALILDLEAWLKTDFQLLSAEPLSYGRIVYLDVTCDLISSPDRPNLPDFLSTCAGQALHNVQRLVLRIVNKWDTSHDRKYFWARLHDAFPLLVTLVITRHFWRPKWLTLGVSGRITSFEWLEILYLGDSIEYLGCDFPRLRHASIQRCNLSELTTLTLSPHLESLLIRSHRTPRIDLTSCSRLKFLGIHVDLCDQVEAPTGDHSLEHLWIIFSDNRGNYQLVIELLKRLLRVPRVTIDLSSVDGQWRTQVIQEFQKLELDSVGMKMRPSGYSDSHLVIDR